MDHNVSMAHFAHCPGVILLFLTSGRFFGCGCDHQLVGAVSQGLNEQFDHTGIQIDGRVREPVTYDAMRPHSVEEALSGAVAECVQKFGAEPRFIVCIKPDDGAGLYGNESRS
jgi:hypothetical protein